MADPEGDEGSDAKPFPLRLVIALTLSAMLTPLNSTMLTVVLGPIGREFRRPDGTLTMVLVTSYLITSIVMQAPAGKLGDRVGHRRALGFGQGAFLIGSLAAMLAPTFGVLGFARVVMATGGALIVPSAGALLRLELPPDKRGQAFGIFGASMGLSAAIGPILGGPITEHAGWRATFLVNLLILPVAAWLARPEAGAKEEHSSVRGFRFDVVGSLLLGGALVAVVVGARLTGTVRLGAFVLGLVLSVAFGLWESRHPEPVVDLSLLTRRVFVAGGLIIALHNLAMYALLFELPAALDKILHLGTAHAGRLLGVLMISMVCVAPIAGRLADRFGSRVLAVTGCLSALAGIGALMVIPLRGPSSAVAGLVLMGIGLGLAGSPAQASAMNATPRESSGVAAAVLATMRYLGGVAGIIVLGFVWHGSTDAQVASAEHQRALHYFAGALALALACATMLPREAAQADAR